MVPTPSLDIGDFTPADTGNLAGPMPECRTAFRSGGRLAAVNGQDFTNHDFKQRRRVSAAVPLGQRRGFRGGE
jgi:hypothetical protein